MIKQVTIGELKEFCNEHKPKKISFLTENQEWFDIADPCKLTFSFPLMLLHENPNIVFLKSGNNSLSLDRVRYAVIDTKATLLGTLVTVFCGDDRKYTLVLSY